jgi:hypothetical protein
MGAKPPLATRGTAREPLVKMLQYTEVVEVELDASRSEIEPVEM